MPKRRVNLVSTSVYAGVPIGPGQNIPVTPEQFDWLKERGHLDRTPQPPDPDSVANQEEGDCPSCGGTGRVKMADLVEATPSAPALAVVPPAAPPSNAAPQSLAPSDPAGSEAEQRRETDAVETSGGVPFEPVGPVGAVEAVPVEPEALPERREPTIDDLGLLPEVVARYRTAGFDTIEKLRSATDQQLDDIDGIGPATVQKTRFGLARI